MSVSQLDSNIHGIRSPKYNNVHGILREVSGTRIYQPANNLYLDVTNFRVGIFYYLHLDAAWTFLSSTNSPSSGEVATLVASVGLSSVTT